MVLFFLVDEYSYTFDIKSGGVRESGVSDVRVPTDRRQKAETACEQRASIPPPAPAPSDDSFFRPPRGSTIDLRSICYNGTE